MLNDKNEPGPGAYQVLVMVCVFEVFLVGGLHYEPARR